MCVDFKNLNDACPKDCYLLSIFDLKVDTLDPFRFKYFLDAYKGYHQVQIPIRMQIKLHSTTILAFSVTPRCYSD
jgi:hypothetical protein